MLINTKHCRFFPFFSKTLKFLLRIIELCRPKMMRFTFWELVAMAAFILLSSSSFVKADPEENSGEMAAWANSFCPDTWNYRTGLQNHLYVLQQELHTEMTQFDLDLTTYIQSTFCFVDEQTPESVALDLHYVWEGLTCLNSTLQILSSKRVRGTRLVARRILNRNKGRLNDAIEDVRTLALKAQRSTYLPHPQLTDDCSLWRNSSDYFLLLSYSFVSRSLTLSQDLMNRCS